MLTKINEVMLRALSAFEREKGQALAEYGLILALIAVVAILALTALGLAVSGKLDDVSAGLA